MLTAIREIGSRLRRTEKSNKLATLIQEPFQIDSQNPTPVVIFITVNLDTDKYDAVQLEEYESTKVNRYLFRKGPSNGPNPMPVAHFTDVEKTFTKKILAWFKEYQKLDETGLAARIGDVLKKNQQKIKQDINDKLRDIDKKTKKLLTIKVIQKNRRAYLGDLEIFPTLLTKIVNAQVEKGSALNQVCSICGEKKQVTGDPQIYKFYTIDKPGFIAGGFNKASAWKNFPLCYECKLDIEEGRRFVEENLRFKFYGLDYFLIPRLLLTEAQPELMKMLLGAKKIISLKSQVKKCITADEDDILHVISQEKDVLTVSFLFLKKEQSAERILLLIEDIFPSRIREIFAAKDRVDALFQKDNGAGFNFGKVRTFFAKSSEGKKNYDLDKYFLEIIDATFLGKKIDFTFLTKFYMTVIRKEFIEERYFKQRVDDALMGVMFFKELGLLSFKEATGMNESIFSNVLAKYAGMLNSPAKQGVFLLGALTQLLLNKQYAERGAAPFRKYLKGLKMDERDFRALLPKVRNKLEEYDSFDKGKAQIAEEVSRSFLEAGENWKIAADELNFYFVCGMNLAEEIAGVVYKGKKEMEV